MKWKNNELEAMIATIQEEEQAKLTKLKEEYQALSEETRNAKMEEKESMKHDLIKKIERLDQDFEVSFSSYVSETDAKSAQYTEQLNK
jgi:Skp family chaperone for outer membrane proteins